MQVSPKQRRPLMGLLVIVLSLGLPVAALAAVGDHERHPEPKQQQVVKPTVPAAENSVDPKTKTSEPAAQAGPEQVSTSNDYEIAIFTSPDPLVKGEVFLMVKLESQTGQALEGARIEAEIQMAHDAGGHGAMAEEPLRVEFQPGAEPGVYQGEVEFTAVGEWSAAIDVTYPGGKSETVQIILAVVNDGPNQIFLGSITAIIMISIIWAGVLKKRQGKGGNSFEPAA